MSTTKILIASAILLGGLSSACAEALSVVKTSVRLVNCAFDTDCVVTNTVESASDMAVPTVTGPARLQVRTMLGKEGAPAFDKTAYQFRVDLSQAVTNAEVACVTDLRINFGKITKVQYGGTSTLDDVFVAGPGIGLFIAEQRGNTVIFTFNQPVCAGDAPGTGLATAWFGLTSSFLPKAATVTIGVPGTLGTRVDARAPDHPDLALEVDTPGP